MVAQVSKSGHCPFLVLDSSAWGRKILLLYRWFITDMSEYWKGFIKCIFKSFRSFAKDLWGKFHKGVMQAGRSSYQWLGFLVKPDERIFVDVKITKWVKGYKEVLRGPLLKTFLFFSQKGLWVQVLKFLRSKKQNDTVKEIICSFQGRTTKQIKAILQAKRDGVQTLELLNVTVFPAQLQASWVNARNTKDDQSQKHFSATETGWSASQRFPTPNRHIPPAAVDGSHVPRENKACGSQGFPYYTEIIFCLTQHHFNGLK